MITYKDIVFCMDFLDQYDLLPRINIQYLYNNADLGMLEKDILANAIKNNSKMSCLDIVYGHEERITATGLVIYVLQELYGSSYEEQDIKREHVRLIFDLDDSQMILANKRAVEIRKYLNKKENSSPGKGNEIGIISMNMFLPNEVDNYYDLEQSPDYDGDWSESGDNISDQIEYAIDDLSYGFEDDSDGGEE